MAEISEGRVTELEEELEALEEELEEVCRHRDALLELVRFVGGIASTLCSEERLEALATRQERPSGEVRANG